MKIGNIIRLLHLLLFFPVDQSFLLHSPVQRRSNPTCIHGVGRQAGFPVISSPRRVTRRDNHGSEGDIHQEDDSGWKGQQEEQQQQQPMVDLIEYHQKKLDDGQDRLTALMDDFDRLIDKLEKNVFHCVVQIAKHQGELGDRLAKLEKQRKNDVLYFIVTILIYAYIDGIFEKFLEGWSRWKT